VVGTLVGIVLGDWCGCALGRSDSDTLGTEVGSSVGLMDGSILGE